METAENKPTTPHRLMRFRFRPNDTLRQESEKLIDTTKSDKPSLKYFASRQLLMSNTDYFEHEGDVLATAIQFRSYEQKIFILPDIQSRQFSEGMTRFKLTPNRQNSFDNLTSLGIRPHKLSFHEQLAGDQRLQQLPNKIPNQPAFGHYIFFDVATHALKGVAEQERAKEAMKTRISDGQLFLNPEGLSYIRDVYLPEDGTI